MIKLMGEPLPHLSSIKPIKHLYFMITNKEYEHLKQLIYDNLISLVNGGLGEIGDCWDEADKIAVKWITENKIVVI